MLINDDLNTRMSEMITGFWVTQIVHGAAVADYAEHLRGGPLPVDELAARSSMNLSAVFRHLRACASLGLVTYDGGAFASTPLLDTLRRDHHNSLRGFALSQPAPGHWRPWGRFVDALQSGERQTVTTLGSEIFDYYTYTPSEADAFTEAMEGLTTAFAPEVARIIDTEHVERVVDVGGASGALLVPLLEANRGLKATLFDLPHIIEGKAFTGIPEPIRQRLDKVGGDFFRAVPAADLYLLKWILHDWDDERCLTILRNCRKATTPGGRIAIIEFVIGSPGEPGPAALMDLNMLVMLTGRERTFAEYANLLSEAGYDDVAITATATPMSVITARASGIDSCSQTKSRLMEA
jgi:hypothetical protein